MADDTSATSGADEETTSGSGTSKGAGSSARRPTRAASAASRARRIGGAGRTTAAARAGGSGRPTGSTPDTDASDPETSGTGDSATEDSATDDSATDDSATDDSATDEGAATPSEGVTLAETDVDAQDDTDVETGTDNETGTDDDPDTAASAARTGGPASGVVVRVPGWLKWAPALVLGLAAIAMIVLVLVAAHSVWYAKPSTSAVRDRVLAAAKTCTAQSNTYSYTSLDKDEASGAACTTGAYTQQFKKAFNRLVKPQAVKLKASQSVQINAAGIENVGRDQWTVVVYGQTKITQSGAKPRTDPFAAEIVMQKAGGEWLIENIKLPSASN